MESIQNDESSDDSEDFTEDFLKLGNSFLVKKEEIHEVVADTKGEMLPQIVANIETPCIETPVVAVEMPVECKD